MEYIISNGQFSTGASLSNKTTIKRILAMQAEKKMLDKRTMERIGFMSFIIPEFGEAYKMNKRKAYLYLKKYGGIDYIYKHWWALHTDNPRYALRDIFDICKMNGGYL